jgi:hypothetical protein
MLTRAHRTYKEQREALKNDPGVTIRGAAHFLMETGNPYFAWLAIEACVKSKIEFPEWLVGYLGFVAEKMLSDEAKKTHDLRKVLPSILGFDMQRGRGNLLDPVIGNASPDAMLLAIKFAINLHHGETPAAALRKAADEIFGIDDAPDLKTLKRWLLKEFEQEKWLRTNAEWNAVAEAHYREHFRQIDELIREVATNGN